jgi:hypothetical protein
MQRMHIASLAVALVAVPIAAGALFAGPENETCFNSGGAQYRITSSDSADFPVRVAHDISAPDIRLQLVDTPELADFVLIDDGETSECAGSRVKSIRADTPQGHAKITVSLSDEAADFKLYVRSQAFSREQAAALFAVLWRTPRRETLNAHR